MEDKINNPDGQVTRFWNKLNLLAEISSILRSNPPSRETFITVLEAIRKILPFEGAVLQLFNKNIGKLEEIISLGEMVSPTDFVDSELAEEFPAWVASHKKPILLSDVKIPSDTHRDKKGSCLIVPLVVDNRLIGIITFAGDCCGFFREKDIRLLSVVGDHMAVSIDRLI